MAAFLIFIIFIKDRINTITLQVPIDLYEPPV